MGGASLKVGVINVSAPAYNLGQAKAISWWRSQGAKPEEISLVVRRAKDWCIPEGFAEAADVLWISAIFSWHVPALIELAQQAITRGQQVEIGGPGTFGCRPYVQHETGLRPQATPDPRFEQQAGEYKAVFWSRGCPAKNCSLGFPRDGKPPICIVPEMEGWRFTLYPDAIPAPMILDNNLSALPRKHQELIVERTLATGFKSVDANSGFEPHSFRLETAELWRRLPLKCWRFAYDEIAERKWVLRTIEILDSIGVKRRTLHIYCIAGNEPIEACEQRVREIQSWGALPIVQRRRPLDWLGGPLPTLYDWTEQVLIDFQRWGNRLSKGMPFSKYIRGFKEAQAFSSGGSKL